MFVRHTCYRKLKKYILPNCTVTQEYSKNLAFWLFFANNMSPLVGIGLAVASLVINIIGLAIPYWLYSSQSVAILTVTITSKTYQGLWSLCVSESGYGQSSSTCVSIPDALLDDAYKATRAMEILGMLVILAAVVCVLLKQFHMKDQALLPKIGAICAFVAGILMIIGTIIFATRDYVNSSDLHAGFALCIIAGIIGIVAGVVIFLGSKANDLTVDYATS